MNLKNVEKQEKNVVVLTIEIPAAEFDAACEKVYRQMRGRLNVHGFRKGKAPRKIIERMYGADIFYEDALNSLYPTALDDAVKEAGLEVVGYPQVNVDHAGKDGVQMTATLGVKPEVKLGQYKGIEAPKDTVEVTDEDVDNEMKPFISRATTQETVERAVEMGDTAVIDFEGFRDGVPFDGGKGENYSLKIGSGTFIPGFEEQVVGMTPGQEKDIELTFPEDYGAAELAGAAVVFHVKVNEIKADIVPELDDEFAKDVSEFETLDELKADLRAKVLKRKEDAAQTAFETAVMDKAIANAGMEVPDTMVEYELDRQLENFENRVASYGMKLDQYLGMMGTNREEFRENQRTGALRSIQQDLLLEAVVKAEGIEATQEEKDAEVKRLAEEYSMEEDKVRSAVSDEQLANGVNLQKASNVIVESAVAVAP